MITSPQNTIVKRIARLRERKHRDNEGMFVLEGRKFTDEIPSNWEVNCFVISESYDETYPVDVYAERAETITVSDSIFKRISDTVTPQGVLAVCHKKKYMLSEILECGNPLIVMAEALADPGNLGTLLRTADAAGAAGFILSKGSADIYSPKVLRAAAGSIFHVPFIDGVDLKTAAGEMKKNGVTILAAHLKAAALPYGVDMTGGCCILIGNEAQGLSDEAVALADIRIKIPMPGRAESLNASVAGGILIYEAVRQRMGK